MAPVKSAPEQRTWDDTASVRLVLERLVNHERAESVFVRGPIVVVALTKVEDAVAHAWPGRWRATYARSQRSGSVSIGGRRISALAEREPSATEAPSAAAATPEAMRWEEGAATAWASEMSDAGKGLRAHAQRGGLG